MFSDAMNNSVMTAQSILDICCAKGNIVLIASGDIMSLNQKWELINPLNIDFTKRGFFSKRRIRKYWDTFEREYVGIKNIIDKFEKNVKIISNTLVTLNTINKSFMKSYTEFIEKGNIDDEDFIQQKLVTDNVKQLLENTMNEYKYLQDKLNKLIVIVAQALDTAIVLAKTQSRDIVGVECIGSNKGDYKENYTEVQRILGV